LVASHVGLAGLVVAALAFGSDLVPGELRRNRLGFLARMPADFRTAFVAKLLFYVLALAGFAALAYVSTSFAGAAIRRGEWLPAVDWRGVRPLLDFALVGASWIFAVSCWLPRGTLALPAMALSLAAWGAPVLGAFLLHPEMKLRPDELAIVCA